jgi:hypothetical protein
MVDFFAKMRENSGFFAINGQSWAFSGMRILADLSTFSSHRFGHFKAKWSSWILSQNGPF